MQILFLVYLGDKIIKQTDTLSPSDQLVFKETEGAEETRPQSSVEQIHVFLQACQLLCVVFVVRSKITVKLLDCKNGQKSSLCSSVCS